MKYDYIIVGGGISGLYSAYRLIYNNQSNTKLRILLLEKNKKRWIGGRMGYYPFHGVDVSIGCGIGRKKKDTLLIQLMHDLGVSYKESRVTNQIADNIEYSADIPYIVSLLTEKFLELKRHDKNGCNRGMTFKEFALPILGKKLYSTFLITAGYTDFENEDVYETLNYYGMDDNTSGWTGLSISWRNLLKSLLEKLERKIDIRVLAEVVDIDSSSDDFAVTLKSGGVYYSKQVILATTVSTLRTLLPQYPIYHDIVGQPFLRIYGKFSNECIPLLREHFSFGTMVRGSLHRIIPINIDAGILLIAYTDNKGALALKNYTDNTVKTRDSLCRLIERSCDLPQSSLFLTDIVSFYWDIGTHYYRPLRHFIGQSSDDDDLRKKFIYEAQHPMPGMLVVGEMVSRNQGWIEGALESVDAVLS